jgi:hypothetical protein
MTLTSALTCSIEMSSELNGMSILDPAAGTVSTYLIGTTAAAESCLCRHGTVTSECSVSMITTIECTCHCLRNTGVCATASCVLWNSVHGCICSPSSNTIAQLRKNGVTVLHCSAWLLVRCAAYSKRL